MFLVFRNYLLNNKRLKSFKMKKSITITEGNLRKIIESVIAEAGFRKFGYSKKATDPNAPRKGRIQVDHCKLEKARSAATGQEKE